DLAARLAAGAAAAAAEYLFQSEAFGLDQRIDLFAQFRRLFLGEFFLARLRARDQVGELVVIQGFEVDCHGSAFLIIWGGSAGILPDRAFEIPSERWNSLISEVEFLPCRT